MMTQQRILEIRDFESLVRFLADELDWPIDLDNFDDWEDLAFEFTPQEIGLDDRFTAKVREIKQLRPLTAHQPWGVFYIDFEPRRLPITPLRRILNRFIKKKRARSATGASWEVEDLLFVTAQGEDVQRGITFAHFHRDDSGRELLREFSWDQTETHLHYLATDYLENLRWPQDTSDRNAWRLEWRRAFRGSTRQAIRTSKELATVMAALAQDIRKRVREVYEVERDDGPLHRLFEAFKKILLHDLVIDSDKPTDNKFADLYAQTITYGLFSARAMHTGGHFGLEQAIECIPKTNPFLKELFSQCFKAASFGGDGIDLDELGVNRLIDLLDSLNAKDGTDRMQRILREFGRQTRGEDPVIHFYEGFLDAYEKEQRKRRGVYYTPDPVVSFIVSSIDRILRKDFGLPLGLADTTTWQQYVERKKISMPPGISPNEPFVRILDPATGTGTFLKQAIRLIYKTMTKRWRESGLEKKEIDAAWNQYVPKNILGRLVGFELMMAPYSVAHMKLGLILGQTNYDFKSGERLGVFLTNTLEKPMAFEELSSEAFFLADEAFASNKAKDCATPVVFGNPPYSVSSANRSKFILELMDDYKEDVKDERNIQPLSDDYIKFIRFAHWKIVAAHNGVLGFVTNNAYFSGIIHRGMRRKLLEDFDSIYVLNLHGSSRINERNSENGKDKNVFDIQQAVSIVLCVKSGTSREDNIVNYADLWGSREKKYRYLVEQNVQTIDWQKIEANSPYYFFVPKDFSLQDEYKTFWKITDIFEKYSFGVTTSRDHFVVGFTREEVEQKLEVFEGDLSDDIIKGILKLKDTGTWKLSEARGKIRISDWRKRIYPYAYRPWDNRQICYEPSIIERDRKNIMQSIIDKDNLGLNLTRRLRDPVWSHVYVTRYITDKTLLSSKDNCYFFPLYYHEDILQGKILDNYQPQFLRAVAQSLGVLPNAIDLFCCIYAILFTPLYRSRYQEFLKIDFPRIPFPVNLEAFEDLSTLGKRLLEAHLLRTPENTEQIAEFPKLGSNFVEKVSYKQDEKKIFINRDQYFSGVPQRMWEYKIGGYDVCDKWLKDRKGRNLTKTEIRHYCRILTAINSTMTLQHQLDEVYSRDGQEIEADRPFT